MDRLRIGNATINPGRVEFVRHYEAARELHVHMESGKQLTFHKEDADAGAILLGLIKPPAVEPEAPVDAPIPVADPAP